MPIHRFAIGQAVRLKRRFGHATKATETFHITGTLPERDNSPQYRIRHEDERHERVTTEDFLEAIEEKQRQDQVFGK